MKLPVHSQVGKNAFNKVDNIYKELLKNNIKIKKPQIYDMLICDINEKEIIEKFKRFKNKKINNLGNNDFWDLL